MPSVSSLFARLICARRAPFPRRGLWLVLSPGLQLRRFRHGFDRIVHVSGAVVVESSSDDRIGADEIRGFAAAGDDKLHAQNDVCGNGTVDGDVGED